MFPHPYADAFPMLPELELAALANDIEANGQLHPIICDQLGRIVDGRNRYEACASDIVEALLYEAADESRTAGDQIRRGRSRKGYDAQYYWNKASKAVRDLERVFKDDKKRLRQLIEEVMAETDVEEETAA